MPKQTWLSDDGSVHVVTDPSEHLEVQRQSSHFCNH